MHREKSQTSLALTLLNDSMSQQSTLFEQALDQGDAVIKNGLCNLCKGTRRLCGKDRCPLMFKFYSHERMLPKIDTRDIAGSSPPAVFVGRYGYPKVDIGPLLPTEFGDTSMMDSPERWVGKSVDEIASMRFGLVRGKYRIDATDFRKAGRIVDNVQEIALTEKSIDVETRFDRKPTGRVVLDDEVMPFGPSGSMEQMTIGNGRFERNLEKSFYDTDMCSTDAVIAAYNNGTAVSEIQKAFSVGTMGVARNRRFVPTRWSITAVDDIIGKDLAKEIRFNPTIDEYRLYRWTGLDNRWCIIMMPTTWRYEMIEAWFPQSSWNPSGSRIDIIGDHEGFDGRSKYASITGSYYAARLAVCEMLRSEGRSAAVIVLREIHPGYDIPLGVWNIRENVREALRHPPVKGESLEQIWPAVEEHMDVRRQTWHSNSEILKDWKVQRRIDDYYRDQPDRLLRGEVRMGRAPYDSRLQACTIPIQHPGHLVRPQPVRRVLPWLRLLLRARIHSFRSFAVEGRPGQAQHRRQAGQGAALHGRDDRRRDGDRPLPARRIKVPAHQEMPGHPGLQGEACHRLHEIGPGPQGQGDAERDGGFRRDHRHIR